MQKRELVVLASPASAAGNPGVVAQTAGKAPGPGAPTVAFTTLGCKVNQSDTQKAISDFRDAGFRIVPAASPAEVYVVNTCSVTHVADLAAALLELAAGTVAGPLHVAGPDAVSRHELACLVAARHGRDPGALRSRPADPGRPGHVVLDSSAARDLLATRLRGVREVLGR